MYNSVEGIGTVIVRTTVVGERISRDTAPLQEVPEPGANDWKKAQRLVIKGWQNLGFKWGSNFVFPSEKLIEDHIPASETTIEAKRAVIKTWALEFVAMNKNPKGYKKLTDGSWDFDIFMDMLV